MLRFGTDGVRGDADTALTPALVSALGTAAARVLGAHTFLVGSDTRESGPRIVDDLVRGFGVFAFHRQQQFLKHDFQFHTRQRSA